jgi:hypothetical protein
MFAPSTATRTGAAHTTSRKRTLASPTASSLARARAVIDDGGGDRATSSALGRGEAALARQS